MKGKVLLGMSGGIDSTVSAMLLLEQGYEVVGVTFRTYDSMKESCLAKEKGCCTIDSIMEAKHNAERMGFEHHIVDFRESFRRCVIQDFIDEYLKSHADATVDYIHNEDSLRALARKKNAIGFLFSGMSKDQLFKTVMFDGALPRKTFSMGHAEDKRYYMECRSITTEGN